MAAFGNTFKKVGESGVGGATLLQKESSEIDENGGKIAESIKISQAEFGLDSANSQNLVAVNFKQQRN